MKPGWIGGLLISAVPFLVAASWRNGSMVQNLHLNLHADFQH
jgi:hypothetical protein